MSVVTLARVPERILRTLMRAVFAQVAIRTTASPTMASALVAAETLNKSAKISDQTYEDYSRLKTGILLERASLRIKGRTFVSFREKL